MVLQGTDYTTNISDLESSERHSQQLSPSVLLKMKLQILSLFGKSQNQRLIEGCRGKVIMLYFPLLLMLFPSKQSAAVA